MTQRSILKSEIVNYIMTRSKVRSDQLQTSHVTKLPYPISVHNLPNWTVHQTAMIFLPVKNTYLL